MTIKEVNLSILISIKQKNTLLTELQIPGKYILGRSRECDCKLDDDKISSKHCSIECTKDGKIIFTDLDSTNGSFLNGLKIKTHQMVIGDIIKIGNINISIDNSKLSSAETTQLTKKTNEENKHPREIVFDPDEKTGLTKMIKLKR
jgi:pSer/pThr/pTyr-binding forkhead associated (FHA) protein